MGSRGAHAWRAVGWVKRSRPRPTRTISFDHPPIQTPVSKAMSQIRRVEPGRLAQEEPGMRTMNAAVVHRRGDPEVISVDRVPVPDLKPGELLVKVRACALYRMHFCVRTVL